MAKFCNFSETFLAFPEEFHCTKLVNDKFSNQPFNVMFYTITWLTRLTHLPQCRIYGSLDRVSIGSDNGLSPIRHQAIILTKAELLSTGIMVTNFSEYWIKLHFCSRKFVWKGRLRNGGHFLLGGWVKSSIHYSLVAASSRKANMHFVPCAAYAKSKWLYL